MLPEALKTLNIGTPHLTIRRFASQDSDGLFALVSDADTCSDDGGYDPIFEKDAAFYRLVEQFSRDERRYSILLSDCGRMIGTIHLMDPIPERAVAAIEIGYCVEKSMRRHGYGFEAAAAMIDRCFSEGGIRLITAGAFAFNEKSQKMLEKLGFIREGITRCAVNHGRFGPVDLINYYLETPY